MNYQNLWPAMKDISIYFIMYYFCGALFRELIALSIILKLLGHNYANQHKFFE